MNNGQLLYTTSRVTNVPWAIGPRPFMGVGDNGAVTRLQPPATPSLQWLKLNPSKSILKKNCWVFCCYTVLPGEKFS